MHSITTGSDRLVARAYLLTLLLACASLTACVGDPADLDRDEQSLTAESDNADEPEPEPGDGSDDTDVQSQIAFANLRRGISHALSPARRYTANERVTLSISNTPESRHFIWGYVYHDGTPVWSSPIVTAPIGDTTRKVDFHVPRTGNYRINLVCGDGHIDCKGVASMIDFN